MVMRQQKRCLDCMYFNPDGSPHYEIGTCHGTPPGKPPSHSGDEWTAKVIKEDNWACTLFDDGEEPKTVQISTGRRDMRVE